MAQPGASRWLALAALQFLLRPSTAALVIVAGPRELVGLSLASPRFAFTPKTFRVRAPLALVDSADFDYGPGRLGAYCGNQSFSGKIVVHHAVPWGLVSAEQHARALGVLGAVGWVMANTDELVLHVQGPCTPCRMWNSGDTRSLTRPVAVDITSKESVFLVGALRAGLELVAELSPSPFPGAQAYGSWWFWLLSTACTLQICIVFELVVAKLHAFARADAGLRASVPVIMLLVELWLCLLRFVLCTVDPFFSHIVVGFREEALVLSQASLLATISSSLFLVFFADAAASSGMASMTIGSRYKRRLLWFISLCIALYVVVDVLSFTVLAPVDQGRFFIIFKVFYLGFCFPAVTLVMAIVTSRRVHKALRAATTPPSIVDRINTFMVRAIVLELVYLNIGAGYLFAIVGAREWDIAWSALLHSLLITKSFQYVSAFKPLGVRVWRGPLNIACSLAARALFQGGSKMLRYFSRRSYFGSGQGQTATVNPAITQSALPDDILLGVSLCFLRDFCEAHALTPGDPTRIISNLLDAAQISVCAAKRDARSSDGRRAVSKATHFVSHAQGCSFRKLIDAMEGFVHANALSERNTYLWIDVFCLPQANVQAYVSRIGEIERRIGSVVMVLDPWIAPVCLTRVWCLYEVVHTVPSTRDAAGITFHLTLSSSERVSFVAAYEKFGKQHIEDVLAAFDARNAMATVEADKHMIFALIASTFGANEGHMFFRSRRSSSRNPSIPSSKRGSSASAHSDCSGALALATPGDIVLDSKEAFVRFNKTVRVALMGALTGLSWQI